MHGIVTIFVMTDHHGIVTILVITDHRGNRHFFIAHVVYSDKIRTADSRQYTENSKGTRSWKVASSADLSKILCKVCSNATPR
jgi:hypothetical protein